MGGLVGGLEYAAKWAGELLAAFAEFKGGEEFGGLGWGKSELADKFLSPSVFEFPEVCWGLEVEVV